MSNNITINKAKNATRQLSRMLIIVEALLKPFLFSSALKEEVENFKHTLLSIADTEVSFLKNQAELEPIQKQIRNERLFNKVGLH